MLKKPQGVPLGGSDPRFLSLSSPSPAYRNFVPTIGPNVGPGPYDLQKYGTAVEIRDPDRPSTCFSFTGSARGDYRVQAADFDSLRPRFEGSGVHQVKLTNRRHVASKQVDELFTHSTCCDSCKTVEPVRGDGCAVLACRPRWAGSLFGCFTRSSLRQCPRVFRSESAVALNLDEFSSGGKSRSASRNALASPPAALVRGVSSCSTPDRRVAVDKSKPTHNTLYSRSTGLYKPVQACELAFVRAQQLVRDTHKRLDVGNACTFKLVQVAFVARFDKAAAHAARMTRTNCAQLVQYLVQASTGSTSCTMYEIVCSPRPT